MATPVVTPTPNGANTVPVNPNAPTGTDDSGQSYNSSQNADYGIPATAPAGSVFAGPVGTPSNPAPATNGTPTAPSSNANAALVQNLPSQEASLAQSEEATYQSQLAEAQTGVQNTENYYNNLTATETAENTSATNAANLASGMAGGSGAAASFNQANAASAQQASQNQQAMTQQIEAIYASIDQAGAQYQSTMEQEGTDAQAALTAQTNLQNRAIASAQSFGKTGMTGAQVQSLDPTTWATLLQQTGYTPLQLTNIINASLPAAANLQQQTVAAPSSSGNGTTVTVVTSSINPITGATQQQQTSYTLAIPYADYAGKNLGTASDGTPIYYQVNPDGTTTVINA